MGKCNKCGNEKYPIEAKFCPSCGTQLGGRFSKLGTRVVETTFENKCAILGQLWLNHRNTESFAEFFEYNDLGLPLAYILNEEIADGNETSEKYIEETFALLLEELEIEDQGFEDLEALLKAAL